MTLSRPAGRRISWLKLRIAATRAVSERVALSFVAAAKAGAQGRCMSLALDSRLRGNDDPSWSGTALTPILFPPDPGMPMKFARICIALAAIIVACSFSGPATSRPKQLEIDTAGRLFQSGKFAKAGKLYSRIAKQNPNDYSAILQLGRIALLSNRLDGAQKWLERAIILRPGDADAKVMLAEVFYRRDDFQKAAAALNGVEVSSNKLIISQYPTLNVAKLKSFKGQTPYEVQGNGTSTRLKFLKTDPLPVVNVRINGGDEVTFFIDTGGSEVALDTEFARELGVPQFGAVQGTFSGGQHAEVQQGRIATLAVGDWTIKNLPAVMLPLRQLSKDLGVKRIDGCLGTTLLYHFLATMDYPQGELVLRRKTAKSLDQFVANSSRGSSCLCGWRPTISWWAGVVWRRCRRRFSLLTRGCRVPASNWPSRSSRKPASNWRKTKRPKEPVAAGR
jgi:hypothetical protein